MSEYTVNEAMSVSDAMKLIKRMQAKGRVTLFICVGQRAPIKDNPGREFSLLGNVQVTTNAAFKFLRDTYSETLEARGAQVQMIVLGECVFIGSAA